MDALAPKQAAAPSGADAISVARVACLVLAVLPPLLFLAAALVRRLNFDESLALRAGWLALAGIPAQPDFLMPTTLALGALGHAVDDPGAVFAIARAIAAASVLAVAGFALLRAKLPRAVAVATVLLCLVQASFSVHAYEFRYDWAIVVGWLGGSGLLLRRSRADLLLAGVCVAWLLCHQLKGVFFGGALYLICVTAILLEGELSRRLAALHLGIAIPAAAWLAFVHVLGMGGAMAQTYRLFAGLALDEGRVWVWTSLGGHLMRDAAWWTLALAAVIASASRILRVGIELGSPRFWALVFATPPLVFLIVHPHPWHYMLALPAPFLALLVASWGSDLLRAAPRERAIQGAIALCAAVALHASLVSAWPFGTYWRALSAPATQEVESLRMLKREAVPGERVLDPSGLVYFLPPCTEQWYLDSLFQLRAERGEWMSELADLGAAECPWALHTYRIRMIPQPTRDRLGMQYQRAGGALLRPKSEASRAAEAGWRDLRFDELSSFRY